LSSRLGVDINKVVIEKDLVEKEKLERKLRKETMRERTKLIEDRGEVNMNNELLELLKELCLEQHKVMKFINKVNHQTLMSELKKPSEKQDALLIDLAGGTCDCLNDPNDKALNIILKLESEYGMNFRSRGE